MLKGRITSDELCLDPALIEHPERRLNFSFSAIQNHVLLLHDRLRDLNGPRGGNDNQCQILVSIAGSSEVVIKQVHDDFLTAIDLAAQRSAYQAGRRMLKKCKAALRQRFFFPDIQPTVFVA